METSNSNFFNIGSPCEIYSPLKKLNWNIGHIYSIGCKKHNNYSHEYTYRALSSQQKEKKSHKLFWVVNLDFWIRATCVNPDRLAFWLMKQFYSHRHLVKISSLILMINIHPSVSDSSDFSKNDSGVLTIITLWAK